MPTLSTIFRTKVAENHKLATGFDHVKAAPSNLGDKCCAPDLSINPFDSSPNHAAGPCCTRCEDLFNPRCILSELDVFHGYPS